MKNETKLKLALGLSIVAILASTAVVILWACDALHYSVVTLDTFIGVVVALLAIIVTIILGWQIYNAIDIRQRMKKIDEMDIAQQQQQIKIEDDFHRMRHLITLTWGEDALRRNDVTLTVRYYIASLDETLQMEQSINVDTLINFLSKCISQIPNRTPIQQDRLNDIIVNNDNIRKSNKYSFIRERYEALYDDFIRKVIVEE